MGGLITLAWITLWVWEQSPYGRYLNHQKLADLDLGSLNQAGFYVVGWCLMLVAMMLPTSLPLVEMFRRLTHRRDDHRQLVALLIAGYIAVWLGFGLVANIFDWSLHELVEAVPYLVVNAWIFGAAVLIVAGAFQFSSLKWKPTKAPPGKRRRLPTRSFPPCPAHRPMFQRRPFTGLRTKRQESIKI